MPFTKISQSMIDNNSSLGSPAYSLAILNRFEIAANHDLPMGAAGQGVFDEFSSDTLETATGLTYDSNNDKYINAEQSSSSIFAYTGAAATYTIPANVTTITFKAWGGGGGSGGTSHGGGGGFVQEDISVTPGESLNVKVGGAGLRTVNGPSRKGGGGGWTCIDRAGTVLAGAGAGGGGGDGAQHGGHGGGVTGGDSTGGRGPQAFGGTQTAGGFAGVGGIQGSAGTGGRAGVGSSIDAAGGFNGGGIGDGDNATWTSGGGGAGYFGGGGAGGSSSSDGGGGGGSGYAPTGTNTAANLYITPNQSDEDYLAGTGNGGIGGSNQSGQHGHAVIKYELPFLNSIVESISTTITADPTDLRFDFIITETDALTLGTDITVKGSRDGGVTYTAATLSKVGTLPTGESHIKAEVDVSGQPSGTAMRYKLETFNEKRIELKFVYQLPIY